MPCRNPCKLYIHLAFKYFVGPSSVVWSELGPPAPPFPLMRMLVTGFQSHVWSGPHKLGCQIPMQNHLRYLGICCTACRLDSEDFHSTTIPASYRWSGWKKLKGFREIKVEGHFNRRIYGIYLDLRKRIQKITTRTMIGENQQLVTNEPVEFEKEPVEVQDCRKITDHFRGIYRIYPNLMKENRRMWTCNRLDF